MSPNTCPLCLRSIHWGVSPRTDRKMILEPVITGGSRFDAAVGRYHGLGWFVVLYLGLTRRNEFNPAFQRRVPKTVRWRVASATTESAVIHTSLTRRGTFHDHFQALKGPARFIPTLRVENDHLVATE